MVKLRNELNPPSSALRTQGELFRLTVTGLFGIRIFSSGLYCSAVKFECHRWISEAPRPVSELVNHSFYIPPRHMFQHLLFCSSPVWPRFPPFVLLQVLTVCSWLMNHPTHPPSFMYTNKQTNPQKKKKKCSDSHFLMLMPG